MPVDSPIWVLVILEQLCYSRVMSSRARRSELYYIHKRKAEEDLADALLSLDYETIERMARRWGLTLPLEPLLFWVVVHKTRAALHTLPWPARMYSAFWLTERGYSPVDEA